MYMDTYVESLDLRIATEGPETAHAEKKTKKQQCTHGLSNWLEIRQK